MAVSTPFATPGFTPEDSAARLARVQAAAAESGVDGILFVGGVDGRDNLGSVQGLNYLLGGLSGYDLLERQRVVSPWLEDVVLFVTPDAVDVHVGPEAYEIVRPVAAVWSRGTKVTVRALPPRRVAAAERDAETRAEAKRQEEARRRKARLEGDDVETREEENTTVMAPTEDDASTDASRSSEEDGSDDSETDDDDYSDDDDEDAAQDFKLESFVDMFVGMKTIGISVVVPYSHDSHDSSLTNRPSDPFLAASEVERWPLLMAYGLEGVGRSGFFTMNFNVKNVGAHLLKTCYARLDRASLIRDLDHNIPQFIAQWLDVVESLEESSAKRRAERFAQDATRTPNDKKGSDGAEKERAFAEALFDFFEYGSLRAPVGVRPACVSRDAPRVTLRGTHATVEATHPKSPGVKIARTFFPRNGARKIAAANGFVENDRFFSGGVDMRDARNDDDDAIDAKRASLLAGAHAGVVAAARAAARARLVSRGSTDSAAAATARAAFSAAAETSGIEGPMLANLADALVINTSSVSFAREIVEEDEDEDDTGTFLYVRAGIETVCSHDASNSFGLQEPFAVAVAHGDTYARGEFRDGQKNEPCVSRIDSSYPVSLTASVPVALYWPNVEEERVCEDARSIIDRATRDARARGGRSSHKKTFISRETELVAGVARPTLGGADDAADTSSALKPRNPLLLATDPVAAAAEEAAFFDDELMSSSEDEDGDDELMSSSSSDDDDSGPSSRWRFVLDSRARSSIGERSSLLLPTFEKTCAFPAFKRLRDSSGPGDDRTGTDGINDETIEALRELLCPRDGVARGEWRVFDDGVAFVPENKTTPLILTLGRNVVGVDVYDAELSDEDEDDALSTASASESVINAYGAKTTKSAFGYDDARAARKRAFASATVVAFRLKPDAETGFVGTLQNQQQKCLSMCFSLACMPAKSRRKFLREVLPRWKALGAADALSSEPEKFARRVSEGVFLETHALSWRTRVALARARKDALSAAASLGLGRGLRAPIGFGAADAMADAALDRASRRDAERAAARVDARARRGIFVSGGDDVDDDDEASSSRTALLALPDTLLVSQEMLDVPVSLLTGAPDGCQSAVFEALELYAPNAASWIEAPVATETFGEGFFVSENAFVSALRAVSPRVAAALAAHRNSLEKTPPPRVVLVARTRATPRVARRAFRKAVLFLNEEEETTKKTIRYVAGATASCVTASGFFPEAERRPADCAAAADGADVVVLLPTAATERGDRADAAAVAGGALTRFAFHETPETRGGVGNETTKPPATNKIVFCDPDAETPVERLEDARRWLVGFLGKATADARLVVGRARLRRDPVFAVTETSASPGGEQKEKSFFSANEPRRRANAQMREPRETGRLTILTGRLDVAAVAENVRALFVSGRAPPPPSPETLKGLAPTARLERQLARFAERKADGAEDAPFRATHARVTVTFVDEENDDEKTTNTKTVACNFSSAAPFFVAEKALVVAKDGEKDSDATDKKTDAADRRPFYASRVEVFLLGFQLGKADVAKRLSMCAYAGPSMLERFTSDGLSLQQKTAIEDALIDDDQNVPPGWYHDGCKWIDFDGSVSFNHPLFYERAERFAKEANVKIELENALRAEAREKARAATRVVRDEEIVW